VTLKPYSLRNPLKAYGDIDLYYLDQAGFCLILCVPYGWQPVGETLGIPSRRSKSLNVLGIMNRHNDLKAYTSEQSINSDVVIHCIETFWLFRPNYAGLRPRMPKTLSHQCL
jgi:hypothetical protein